MSLLTNASIALLPDGGKAGKLYSLIPTDGSGDFTVVRALDTATRVNEDGLIESVAANIPRIDFSEGGCGELLVEPERENLLGYTEDFSNAYWIVQNSATLDSNVAEAPDGATTADRINIAAVANSRIQVASGIAITPANTYTLSCYVKTESGTAQCNLQGGGDLNTINETFTATTEWQRLEVTGVAGSGLGGLCFPQFRNNDATAKSFLIWGFQLEEGNYPTSYIPNNTAGTVTRNTDFFTITGIPELLSDSSGTVFFEGSSFDVENFQYITIYNEDQTIVGKQQFALGFDSIGRGIITQQQGATTTFAYRSESLESNVTYKMLGNYSTPNASLTIDGTLREEGSDFLSFPENSIDKIQFTDGNDNSFRFYGRLKTLLIYNAALASDDSEILSSYASFAEIANNKNYTIL